MNDDLAKRVRAAASAGWVTILIFAAVMFGTWLIWVTIMYAEPPLVLRMWGGATWETVQAVSLRVFALYKLMLVALLMLSVFLTLWARKLRRTE